MAVVVAGRKGSGVRRTDSYRDRKLLELEEKLSEVCKQNETLLKKNESLTSEVMTLQDRVRTLSRPVSSASGMSVRADSELDELDEDSEGGGLDDYDSDTTLRGDEEEEEGRRAGEEEGVKNEDEGELAATPDMFIPMLRS
ncbi:hypothetical protein ACHWQZ_G009947 [Mnemiopsis leidyi]